MNETERFQFEILKRFAITGSINSLDKWFLEIDFNHEKANQLFNILNEFSKKPDFSHGEFEQRMNQEFGWGYQAVKPLIKSLYEDGMYPEIVFQFLKDMHRVGGNGAFSIEYECIAKELGILNRT